MARRHLVCVGRRAKLAVRGGRGRQRGDHQRRARRRWGRSRNPLHCHVRNCVAAAVAVLMMLAAMVPVKPLLLLLLDPILQRGRVYALDGEVDVEGNVGAAGGDHEVQGRPEHGRRRPLQQRLQGGRVGERRRRPRCLLRHHRSLSRSAAAARQRGKRANERRKIAIPSLTFSSRAATT